MDSIARIIAEGLGILRRRKNGARANFVQACTGVTSRSYYADSWRQVQHCSLSPRRYIQMPGRRRSACHLAMPSDPPHPLPSLFSLSALSSALGALLSATPWSIRVTLAPRFYFSSSPPLPFRPGRLSFRPAREPLISADFARRADPWNPRGYLSPGGSFLSFSLSPTLPLLLFCYPVTRSFLQNSPRAAL